MRNIRTFKIVLLLLGLILESSVMAKIELKLGSAVASPGDIINIPLYLSHTGNVAGLQFQLSGIDLSRLDLVKVSDGIIIQENHKLYTAEVYGGYARNFLVVPNVIGSNLQTGILANLQFTVKASTNINTITLYVRYGALSTDLAGSNAGYVYRTAGLMVNPVNTTSDYDFDGIPDIVEVRADLNPTSNTDSREDADSDGLTNLEEYLAGTDFWQFDTDGDGMSDGWEFNNGSDALVVDALIDSDGDGLTALQEYQAQTDPSNSDTDGDGMLDGWELANGFDPIAYDLTPGRSVYTSIAKNEWKYFRISADNAAGAVRVLAEKMPFGSDVDLYVRAGQKPDVNSFDCRPYRGGTEDENCLLDNTGQTAWYIGINGYRASDFTLLADLLAGSGNLAMDGWDYYTLNAVANIAEIQVTLDGLSGNNNLYVMADAVPDLTNYDCAPYRWWKYSETCTLTNTGLTRWHIGVHGIAGGSYTLEAKSFSYITQPSQPYPVIDPAIPVSGRVEKGQWAFYQLDATDVETQIIVNLDTVENDVDLYIKAGAEPEKTNYDCRPYTGGLESEICEQPNTAATTWYIGVFGYEAGDYTLNVSLQ